MSQATADHTGSALSWTKSVRRRRVPVPTVLQMEAAECGAACLAMVLGHFRRWIPLEELRVACGVSRDGANARGLVLAGRAQGLQMDGYRRELHQLPDEPFPIIAHWRFDHFVVIEGADRQGLFLNDPALGTVRATWQEADEDFTGMVLHAAPGPGFEPTGSRPSLWDGLRRRIRGHWGALIYLLVACVALALPVALAPLALQGFIDRVLIDGVSEWIPVTISILAFAAGMTVWLTWWQSTVSRRLSLALSQSQAVELMQHALRLPIGYFLQRYSGDVAFRVQLVDEVSQVASSQLIPAAAGLVTAVTVALVMVGLSWVLAVVAILIAAFELLAVRFAARWRVGAAGRQSREQSSFSGALSYGLRSIETVKASGTEDELFVMASGRHARAVNAGTRLEISTMALSAVPTLASGLASAAFIAIGGLLVMADELTPGSYVAALALLPLFLSPVGTWASLRSTLHHLRASLDRLDDLLQHPADPACRTGTAGPPATTLEFRDVSFGFSTSAPPLIEGLTLTLRRGRSIGLVGMSGCGKSTAARLAVGLLTPWSGQILLDGEDLRQNLAGDGPRIGYVDQEIVLFPGSVRENITLFDASVSDEQVVAAARAAAIHEEIAERRGGYDGPVTEFGANFSGGQQQRIEIARAVAAAPGLLVLDEATSALDQVKEAEVMAALRATGSGLLIIAHRLSTVRDCDEILVMDRGHIIERGSHDELIAAGGHYAFLVHS